MTQKLSAKITVNSIPITTTARTNSGEYYRSESKYDETSARDVGQSSPGWSLAVKSGVNATTPLSGIKEKVSCGDYTLSSNVASPGTAFYIVKGKHAVNPPGMELTMPDIIAQATIDFQANAAEAMRSFDTGSFLGELTETISLIKHPLNNMGKLASRYNSAASKLSKAKALGGGIADLYLQFVFGVKPLAHDVDSIIKSAQSIANKVERVTVRGKASGSGKSIPHEYVHPLNGEYLPANAVVVGNSSFQHDCRITGAVNLKNVNTTSKTEAIAERFGIGLDQFLPTVYNLVPFSFVLDYFTNVGDAISAVTNFRASYSWSCTTYKITQVTQSAIVSKGPASLFPIGNSGRISGGTFRSDRVYFNRSPGVPPTSLSGVYIKCPSLNQFVNMAALIASFAFNKR